MNRRTFCKRLARLPLLTLCGCASTSSHTTHETRTSNTYKPTPIIRYLHYKPGVRLHEAMQMRDMVFYAMLAKVPRDKLAIIREELFHALMVDQGYIGVNSNYLPEGYIEEPGTGCRMAGLP